jgi:hypothetical protein
MKTTILKSVLFMAFTVGIFSSCVKDDNYGTPQLTGCTQTTLVKNREVSQISAGSIVALHENIVPGVSDVIEAYVTSSDIGGNFFKSISMQTKDGSRAFSVPVDVTNTFINYEPGRKVLIKMDGLYTDSPTSGPIGMRIGSLYVGSSGTASVGRLAEADFRAAVQPSCTIVNENDLLPTTPVTISDVKSDAFLNRLVELNNVQFSTPDISNNGTYYDINNDLGGATNRSLMDLNGSTIIFRTSAYANFAAKSVPVGSGKVRGIITKYGTDYQFIARSEGDVKLSNDINTRFSPLLNENFDTATNLNAWTTFSVTGSQNWVWSNVPSTGPQGGYAKMTGFAGSSNANVDWLISPVQNLSTFSSANLTFLNAYNFNGPSIEAYISNNYDPSTNPNPTLVTWTQLTGFALSPGSYTWTNSGDINISSFTGSGNNKVYIAFKYTSTSSASSTWEIDNVKITGN